ncbi:hypothetical protein [Xanthomonas arboricola]|uniref:hypothetical protein n=1 Tax=Xanthomonas arboricola TaxID=56448 RepID=UPI003EB72BA0
MDINDLKQILTTFADEPSDVEIRHGRITAQIRDDIIDAKLTYDSNGEIMVEENESLQNWRSWIVQRVAKLPQLADRIITTTKLTTEHESRSPFIAPKAILTDDLALPDDEEGEERVEADAADALSRAATNFVPGATSVLYLTSDAGEGKTTLISRVAHLRATLYKEKKCSSLIVPIPLSGRAFLTFDDAVVAALSNRLRFGYYYYDAFLQLVKMNVIVPAFDGYEEMLVEGSKGEAVSALGNLVQSLQSSGSVVIAARKAFFDYLSFRTQARLFDAIGDRDATFSRLQLQRWSKDIFLRYGRRRAVEDAESIYEMVEARLGSDHPLLTRAVLVKRLFDVAARTEDREQLAEALGSHPHDYFYTFVDAIVQREASEKWLAQVAGEVSEPLMSAQEHHTLLAMLAQEMWQTSTKTLRYDVVDVIVDLFCDTSGKTHQVNRQIKERVRQHSLLSSDLARGTGLAFDHEDFQSFYLGESLGGLLALGRVIDIHTFLQTNLVPAATLEQSVQYLERHEINLMPVLDLLRGINDNESSFSFCKENCGSLLIRIAEAIGLEENGLALERLFLPAEALEGTRLRGITFEKCVFQPTLIGVDCLDQVEFVGCEFERLELHAGISLNQVSFMDCKIDSLVLQGTDDLQSFDPRVIRRKLASAGATVSSGLLDVDETMREEDERTKAAERLFRSFMRRTHVDESILKKRMGRFLAPVLFDRVIPPLLANRVIEEIPWTGQGIQRRFKLNVPMSAVYTALEAAGGGFDQFLESISSQISGVRQLKTGAG